MPDARQTEGSSPATRPWIWAALLALYVAVRLPLLPVPLERDEGLFGVLGQAILRGQVPYRDVFEHKPPGPFYLYALALLVVPPSAAGVHLFLAVWNLATGLCVASIAAALGGSQAALWAALLFILASAAPSVQGFSASSEMLLLLPLSASVRLALAGVRAAGSGRSALLVLSGLLGGVTFWIKQPAVLGLGVVPLLVLADRRRDVRGAARDLAALAVGALGLSAAVVLPFVLLGLGGEFWYWAFVHSWLYAKVPATAWPQRVVASALNVGRDLAFPLAAAVAGGVVALRRRRPRAWVPPAFLLLSVASAFHSQFLYAHYFALVVPATAVAGGIGLAVLQDASGAPRWFAVMAAALALVLPALSRPWYWTWPDPAEVSARTLGQQGFDAAALVAQYVRERTDPDGRLFVYGSEPEIPFLAGRRDVNPFGVAYPLTWDWPRHREFQERVWAEIERWKPVYLIVPRNPYTLVRSPRMDPFLEQRLTDLGRAAYGLEAVLVRDPVEGMRFRSAPPEPGSEPSSSVLYELWRRAQ